MNVSSCRNPCALFAAWNILFSISIRALLCPEIQRDSMLIRCFSMVCKARRTGARIFPPLTISCLTLRNQVKCHLVHRIVSAGLANRSICLIQHAFTVYRSIPTNSAKASRWDSANPLFDFLSVVQRAPLGMLTFSAPSLRILHANQKRARACAGVCDLEVAVGREGRPIV